MSTTDAPRNDWPPPCRRYLEEKLIPQLSLRGSMLFVGVDYYTAHYRNLLLSEVPFVTVDFDPKKNPDVIADVTNPDLLQKLEQFQMRYKTILFNGVIGYGVNSDEGVDASLTNMDALMEDDGQLLIGWNERYMERQRLLRIIAMHPLAVLPIEGSDVYDGEGKWGEKIDHRYMLLEKK
jgi:hypothetical protein